MIVDFVIGVGHCNEESGRFFAHIQPSGSFQRVNDRFGVVAAAVGGQAAYFSFVRIDVNVPVFRKIHVDLGLFRILGQGHVTVFYQRPPDVNPQGVKLFGKHHYVVAYVPDLVPHRSGGVYDKSYIRDSFHQRRYVDLGIGSIVQSVRQFVPFRHGNGTAYPIDSFDGSVIIVLVPDYFKMIFFAVFGCRTYCFGQPQFLKCDIHRDSAQIYRIKGYNRVFYDIQLYRDVFGHIPRQVITVFRIQYAADCLFPQHSAVVLVRSPIYPDGNIVSVFGCRRKVYRQWQRMERRVIFDFDACRRLDRGDGYRLCRYGQYCNNCLHVCRRRQIIITFGHGHGARYRLRPYSFSVIIAAVPFYGQRQRSAVFVCRRKSVGQRKFAESGTVFHFAQINLLYGYNCCPAEFGGQGVIFCRHSERIYRVAGNFSVSLVPSLKMISRIGNGADRSRLVI